VNFSIKLVYVLFIAFAENRSVFSHSFCNLILLLDTDSNLETSKTSPNPKISEHNGAHHILKVVSTFPSPIWPSLRIIMSWKITQMQTIQYHVDFVLIFHPNPIVRVTVFFIAIKPYSCTACHSFTHSYDDTSIALQILMGSFSN